jgi:uncharacterized protein YqjF (DUF2071 family)
MLSYEVEPRLLLRFVPPGTELDQWNGKTFMSLVGFRFLDTRVFGVPIPFHRNFEEVNLRFYVRRRDQNEVKRGVVFIREIVPRRAIAAAARGLYNENYVALPMSHQIRWTGADLAVEYGWRSKHGWNRMSLAATGQPALPQDGSVEQFITEHFWGYSAQRNGGCKEYRVAQDSWAVWNGGKVNVEGQFEEFYGRDLAGALAAEPTSAMLAEGSAVTVYRGTTIA